MILPSHSILRDAPFFPDIATLHLILSPIPQAKFVYVLDDETLDLVFHLPNLSSKLRGVIGGDTGSDDGARDTASASESGFRRDVDICYVLVFAEEGEVKENGEWAGISSENDNLGDTSVEGLTISQ